MSLTKLADDPGIEYAEFGNDKGEMMCRVGGGARLDARKKAALFGFAGAGAECACGDLITVGGSGGGGVTRNKDGRPRKGGRERRRFDNQVTVVVRREDGGRTNAKVFRNGHVQITGLKAVEDGAGVVEAVCAAVAGASGPPAAAEDPSLLGCHDYRVRLINSDFRAGYEIRRDVLARIIAKEYGLPCSFEPCIYPGCKVQYWFNAAGKKSGWCTCRAKCGGKGTGDGDGECKKVTISVFHTGSVIITGGQSREQIDEAHAFITACLKNNYDVLVRNKPVLGGLGGLGGLGSGLMPVVRRSSLSSPGDVAPGACVSCTC